MRKHAATTMRGQRRHVAIQSYASVESLGAHAISAYATLLLRFVAEELLATTAASGRERPARGEGAFRDGSVALQRLIVCSGADALLALPADILEGLLRCAPRLGRHCAGGAGPRVTASRLASPHPHLSHTSATPQPQPPALPHLT